MNVIFEKCGSAVKFAAESKKFGIFHSTENSPNLNMHTHDCCELLLCVKGGKNFLIDNRVYEVGDGDLFVINQFEPHKLTLRDDCEVDRYVMQLHPEFIFSASTEDTDFSACFYANRAKTSNRISLKKGELRTALGLFAEFGQEHGFGDDIIKLSAAAKLLLLANKAFSERHDSAEAMPESLPLKRALSFINEHLGDDITLDDIAKNSYISVNQLCKIFKSTLGTTVMKYIIGKRISEAKKLLKAGNNVSDTALMCGFRDYSNFIRTFSASVGISPGKYSKKH